jgi:CRP-like cAMP-binding protein
MSRKDRGGFVVCIRSFSVSGHASGRAPTIRYARARRFQITKLMGQRLERFQSRVEELLCKSAPARLAHALGELADRHGAPDADGVRVPLPAA